MARTLLAGFRGTDGRSLAKALALLFVVVGCLGAIDAGRMTAGIAGGDIFCSTNGAGAAASGNPTMPAARDHCICCALGCGAAAPGVLATAVVRPQPAPLEPRVLGLRKTSFSVALIRPFNSGPRGPPLLA